MTRVEAREEALDALYAADARDLDEIDVTTISARAANLAERQQQDARIPGRNLWPCYLGNHL